MKISDLPQALAELEQAARLRVPDDGIERRTMEQAFGSDFIDAASNDYLGLALAPKSSAGVSRETGEEGFSCIEAEQLAKSLKVHAKSLTSARPPGFRINSSLGRHTAADVTFSEKVASSEKTVFHGKTGVPNLPGPQLSGVSSEFDLPGNAALTIEKNGQRGASFQGEELLDARGQVSSAESPPDGASPAPGVSNQRSPATGLSGRDTLQTRVSGTSSHSSELPERVSANISKAATPTVSRGTVAEPRSPNSSDVESLGEETRGYQGESSPSVEAFEPLPSDLGGANKESLEGSESNHSESHDFPFLTSVSRGTVSGSQSLGISDVKNSGEEARGYQGESSRSVEAFELLPSDLGGANKESLKGSESNHSESHEFPSPTSVSRETVSGSRLPDSSQVESIGEETQGHRGQTGSSAQPLGTFSNTQRLGRERAGQDAEIPQGAELDSPSPSSSGVSRGTSWESGLDGSVRAPHQGEPSNKDRVSDSPRGLVGTSPTKTLTLHLETKELALPPEEAKELSSFQASSFPVSRETEVQGIHDQRALLTSFSSASLSQQPALDVAPTETLAFSASPSSGGETVHLPRTGITVGAGSSRLIFGTSPQHVLLEQELATWVGMPASLLFASGYAANVGALSALLSPEDAVFSDSLNHASLIDGIRLSRARPQVFSHLNFEELEAGLARSGKAPARWVICEAYYSMDGDAPHLRSLRGLCDKYDAQLYVDEAHSLGTFGPRGAGLCALHGILPDVMMAAFGKAVGSQGACVAGSQALRTWLWNRARSFVFSTAPSPLLVAATRHQLERTQAADGERVRLECICSEVRRLLSVAGVPLVAGSFGPVVGLLMGEEERALRLADRLRAAGILAQAVRPPTVPPGASRVRLVLRASLSDKQMQRLVEVVAREVAE